MAETCRCYGDPHCLTFDGRDLSEQGTCTYTMVRDGCTEGYPSGSPTFEVRADFAEIDNNPGVSWVVAATLILTDGGGSTVRVRVSIPGHPRDSCDNHFLQSITVVKWH